MSFVHPAGVPPPLPPPLPPPARADCSFKSCCLASIGRQPTCTDGLRLAASLLPACRSRGCPAALREPGTIACVGGESAADSVAPRSAAESARSRGVEAPGGCSPCVSLQPAGGHHGL
ncbi:hypothetical protein ABPG75_003496 [Micractinium tetrahymenae]